MRYKVVADEGVAQFEQLLRLLDRRQVPVVLKNDFRCMVAIEDPADDVLHDLEELRVRVRPDTLYVPG